VAIRQKTFRYRAYATEELLAVTNPWEDALRFLWNLGNEQWRIAAGRFLAGSFCKQEVERDREIDENGKLGKKRVWVTASAFGQASELKWLRAEFPQLAAVPRNVCTQLLVELDKAWQRCFQKLAKAPKFKKKGVDKLNFCEPHPDAWHLDIDEDNPKRGWLKFPKLADPLRVVVHRPLEGTPKSCTLVREGDQWFVAISCEIEIPDPVPHQGPPVAIDRGITNIIATSDGVVIRGPQFLKRMLKELAHAQRVLQRKTKGSSNYDKAKQRVMRIHRKIRRQRDHFLHVLSAHLAKSHGVIVFEDLNVAGMIRGNCARGIADAAWTKLMNFCRYKLEWSGGGIRREPAQYSSQECFACEHIDAKSRRGEVFCCTKCGHRDHADINAAKVLLRRANRSVLPVEGSLLEGTLRNRKVASKKLRVPRRPSGDSAKPRP